MFELPLFPLHTVLFPGMPVHLHIFEQRYKRMIQTSLETNQLFGVVLIRRGLEAFGPLAEPFPIGCTAKILEVQPLSEGRMNIMAVGQERFRILTLNRESLPYLVGTVQPYPLSNTDPDATARAGAVLRSWFVHYIKLLGESGGSQFDLEKVPEDPVMMAYHAASLLQLPPLEKQQLLSAGSAVELIDSLQNIYRREVALLRAMYKGRSKAIGGFSIN